MIESEDNLCESEAAEGPAAENNAPADTNDNLLPPMPDVWAVANKHIFYSRLQEITGAGGYRRKYSNPPPRNAALLDLNTYTFSGNTPFAPSPVSAIEVTGERATGEKNKEAGVKISEEVRQARVSIKLRAALNHLEIADKRELIRALETYADLFGLFFCPLINPPPDSSKTVLPGEPLKIIDCEDVSCAVFIEPIGEGHYLIKVYQRPKPEGAGGARSAIAAGGAVGDSLWYPLSRRG